MAANTLAVVSVARPGKWGNPFPVGTAGVPDAAEAVRRYEIYILERLEAEPQMLEDLRGRNLACWCKIGQPCHADILLKHANRAYPVI